MGDAAPRERQARFHEAGERPNRAGLVEGATASRQATRRGRAAAQADQTGFARRTQEQPPPKEARRGRRVLAGDERAVRAVAEGDVAVDEFDLHAVRRRHRCGVVDPRTLTGTRCCAAGRAGPGLDRGERGRNLPRVGAVQNEEARSLADRAVFGVRWR